MIALKNNKLICPSCGGSALAFAEQAADLLGKHRRLQHPEAAARAERHMLHHWQAAVDYVAHDRPFKNRLASALKTYQRTNKIPDFKALRWDLPSRPLIVPKRPRLRIENKLWTKNGKLLVQDGKLLACDECPCIEDPGYPTITCGTFCSGNKLPEYITVSYPSGYTVSPGWTCARCDLLVGMQTTWQFDAPASPNCCNYELLEETIPPIFYTDGACEPSVLVSSLEVCLTGGGTTMLLTFSHNILGIFTGTFSLPLSGSQCSSFSFALSGYSAVVGSPCRLASGGTATTQASMAP